MYVFVSLSNRSSICLRVLSNVFLAQIYCFGIMLLAHQPVLNCSSEGAMGSHSDIVVCLCCSLCFNIQWITNTVHMQTWISSANELKGLEHWKKWLKNKRIFSKRFLLFNLQDQSHSHGKTQNSRIFVLKARISPNILNGSYDNFHKIHRYCTSPEVPSWRHPAQIDISLFFI